MILSNKNININFKTIDIYINRHTNSFIIVFNILLINYL